MRLRNTPYHASLRPLAIGAVLGVLVVFPFSITGYSQLAAAFAMLIAFVFILDASARMEEYEWIKSEGSLKHPHVHIRKMQDSFCGRGVTICLFGDYARDYYRICGYRWWHVLPVGSPRCFFNIKFYQSVFKGRHNVR